MAISTFSAYKQETAAPAQRIDIGKTSLTTIAGRLSSLWTQANGAGTAPTTATVPTNSTTGSFGQFNGSSLRLPRVEISSQQAGMWLVVDRLSHQGGLSGIVTTAQTTNLPTAALTRYTSGEGVWAGLEIYSQVGTTATTVTCSYTNSSGTASRTSNAVVFGATNNREAARVIIPTLQSGDTGVRSVESVTVLATTGTAGNFGVTLFKPLLALPRWIIGADVLTYDALIGLGGNLPEIQSNACLQLFFWAQTTSTGSMLGQFMFTED